ncbi:hypothetical protein LINGRAHAP2_LOCUS9467 [Linum grandiflorum]
MIRSLVEDLKLQCQEKVEDNEDEKVEDYNDEVEDQEQQRGEEYDAEEQEREEEYDDEEQEREEEYDDQNGGDEEEEEEMEYQQPSVSSPQWEADLPDQLAEDEEKETFNDYNGQKDGEEESDVELDSQDKETDDDEVMVGNQNDCEAMLPDQNEQIDAFQDQSDEEARSQESNPEADEETGSGSLQYQSPQLISSLGAHAGSPQALSLLGSNAVDTVNRNTSSGNSRNAIMAETVVGHGAPISSSVDVWSAVSMPPQSYYDSNLNYTHDQDYISTPALMASHQANDKQHIQMVDLGSHVRRDLSHRQSDGASFSSCPNPDRSGLLQSLFKGQETLPYIQEQKQEALDFQSQSNVLIEPGHFNGHIQGHLPLGQGQKRHTEDFMQPNLSQDVYSSIGGYIIPRQEQVQPHVNLQDWNVNPVAPRPPTQFPLPSLNGDGGLILNQNWFPADHQVRGGWNGYDTTSSNVGNRIPSGNIGSSTDQTLFSVLSQCNQLRPSSNNPLDSLVASSGHQMMLPRNYNMVVGGGVAGGSTLPPHVHDYLTGREGGGGGGLVMPEEAGWMNLGHNNGISNSGNSSSNSGFHDPMGKPPYLRSWHQQ